MSVCSGRLVLIRSKSDQTITDRERDCSNARPPSLIQIIHRCLHHHHHQYHQDRDHHHHSPSPPPTTPESNLTPRIGGEIGRSWSFVPSERFSQNSSFCGLTLFMHRFTTCNSLEIDGRTWVWWFSLADVGCLLLDISAISSLTQFNQYHLFSVCVCFCVPWWRGPGVWLVKKGGSHILCFMGRPCNRDNSAICKICAICPLLICRMMQWGAVELWFTAYWPAGKQLTQNWRLDAKHANAPKGNY